MDKEKTANARKALSTYAEKYEKCKEAKALGAINKPLERELRDVNYRLSCLPEGQANLLKWFYIDKLSRPEIFEKVGLSQSVVYRRKDDALYAFTEHYEKKQKSRILIKDISVGQYVKVHRSGIEKVVRGDARFIPSLSIGVICDIPEHRRFCTVQFFHPATGKPIYKESFFWSSVAVISRPIGFKGELPERVK